MLIFTSILLLFISLKRIYTFIYMIKKKRYDELKARQEKASRDNDYSTMIMMGSKESNQMNEYYQNNICPHHDIGTDGGGDYCKTCGKRWDR